MVLAWLCAALGMALSLYFSEARGWTPCFLCWYQRICLWPLVPILGIAVLRRTNAVIPYVLPQAAMGMFLALYQVVIQDFVGRDFLGFCRAGPSCVEKVNLGLGPISIPWMSLAAFLLVFALLLRARR